MSLEPNVRAESGYGMWLGSWYTPMTPYHQFEKSQHKLISIYFSRSQIYQKEALWLILCKTFAWTNLKKLKKRAN